MAKKAKKKSASKGVCKKCGYTVHKYHGPIDCPLCKVCEGCDKFVRDCECKEGE